MKKAFLYSLALHGMIILLICVKSWVFKSHQEPLDSKPMVVNFVKTSEKSGAATLAPHLETSESPKKPLPVPRNQPSSSSTESKPAPVTPQTKESRPDQTTRSPHQEALSKPALDSEKVISLSPKKSKPKPSVSSPKKPSKAQVNLKTSKPITQKLLEKSRALPKIPAEKKIESLDDLIGELGDQNGAHAEELSDVLTGSEIDAVRQKIYHCWSIPAGAKGAADLVVDIDIEINPDGTVKKAEIVDQERLKKDGFFRIAAESALRAILDPRCQPLPFPPQKYEQWKSITFSFNPKDLLN
jgi:hypothetical protein